MEVDDSCAVAAGGETWKESEQMGCTLVRKENQSYGHTRFEGLEYW